MSNQTPEATKRYREANRERISDYLKEYGKRPEVLRERYLKRRVKPESQLLSNARSRAKRLGIEIDIEISDIVIPETCPLLGIPIFIGEGKSCNNSPSLDRVHPDKGYTKGNVRVISHKANTKKQDNTIEDFERFIRYMKGDI